MDEVVALLRALKFEDLVPFFQRHHILWVCHDRTFTSPLAERLSPALRQRLKDLQERVRGKKEKDLHESLSTRALPLFRSPNRLNPLNDHLGGHPLIGIEGEERGAPNLSASTTREILMATELRAPHLITKPRTHYQLIAARAQVLAHLAHLYDQLTVPEAQTLFDRHLESLGGLEPMSLSFQVATPQDQPFSRSDAIGIPLGFGEAPWNGKESLCPLYEALGKAISFAFLKIKRRGKAPEVSVVTGEPPFRSGRFLILRLPPAPMRDASTLLPIAALLQVVHLEASLDWEADAVEAEEKKVEAEERMRLDYLVGMFKMASWTGEVEGAVVEFDKQLVKDGGKAILEGRAPIPLTLPHAEILRTWLSALGNSAGASSGFGFQERGRLLFFIGRGLMTKETYPLWRAKASQHVKCSRDLMAILDKCDHWRETEGRRLGRPY